MSLRGKRVGVMMGGSSSEREISMKSGAAVFSALKNAGFDVLVLEVVEETREGIRRLIDEFRVDVVFVAMHGHFGEDGQLQAILEKLKIPYTGPKARASRLAMDKLASRRLFEKAKLSVPKYQYVSHIARRPSLKGLRYPFVVKPSAQGSSIGISFVAAPEALEGALAEALKFGAEALVEEFIEGREITVSVLDGRALPVVEIIPKNKFFDYQAKYSKGLTEYVVPASLEPALASRAQEEAVRAYQALGCRHLSRVDMLIGEDGSPRILEINTIPGMTETSLFPKAAHAAGIGFTELCVRLLQLSLRGDK